jgi:hypothetical protein
LASDGEDLRKLPLHLRKTNLARLLASFPSSSKARSGPTYSGRPASSDSKAWFPSAAIGLTHRAVAGLDQGEKPKSSGHGKGQGVFFVRDIRETNDAR